MRIAPTEFLRPPKARAVEVACAADAHLEGGPDLPATSFAHVLAKRPDPAAILAAVQHLLLAGALEVDRKPGMFVYRAAHGGQRWMGLVCAVDTRDLVPLLVHAATPEEVGVAQSDRQAFGAQLVPALVKIEPSDDVAQAFVLDTNERPGYHFVSHDGGTHSAWAVHHPEAYVEHFGDVWPQAVLCGGAELMAAHLAGAPALAILSSDAGPQASHGPLQPRAGLLVARPQD
jgi:hypothetical protein